MQFYKIERNKHIIRYTGSMKSDSRSAFVGGEVAKWYGLQGIRKVLMSKNTLITRRWLSAVEKHKRAGTGGM